MRRALTWELHEVPVQDLIALGCCISVCRDSASKRSEPAAVLANLRQETTRVVSIVRDACSELHSDVLDLMSLGPAMALEPDSDIMERHSPGPGREPDAGRDRGRSQLQGGFLRL